MNFSIQIIVESGLVPLVVESNARNNINLVLERYKGQPYKSRREIKKQKI